MTVVVLELDLVFLEHSLEHIHIRTTLVILGKNPAFILDIVYYFNVTLLLMTKILITYPVYIQFINFSTFPDIYNYLVRYVRTRVGSTTRVRCVSVTDTATVQITYIVINVKEIPRVCPLC